MVTFNKPPQFILALIVAFLPLMSIANPAVDSVATHTTVDAHEAKPLT